MTAAAMLEEVHEILHEADEEDVSDQLAEYTNRLECVAERAREVRAEQQAYWGGDRSPARVALMKLGERALSAALGLLAEVPVPTTRTPLCERTAVVVYLRATRGEYAIAAQSLARCIERGDHR